MIEQNGKLSSATKSTAEKENYQWLSAQLQELLELAPSKHWVDGPSKKAVTTNTNDARSAAFNTITTNSVQATAPVKVDTRDLETAFSQAQDYNQRQFNALSKQIEALSKQRSNNNSNTTAPDYQAEFDIVNRQMQQLASKADYEKLRRELALLRDELQRRQSAQNSSSESVPAVRTEIQVVRDTVYLQSAPVIVERERIIRDTIVNTVERTTTTVVPKVETRVEYVREELFNLPPDVILFDVGKHAIKPQYNSRLNFYATQLQKFKDIKVQLVGHTDATGNAAANKALSERRAKAVESYLISRGVAANRIVLTGEGAAAPIADNNTAASKSQNRRVEISFIQ